MYVGTFFHRTQREKPPLRNAQSLSPSVLIEGLVSITVCMFEP
jgi:hypothetical protein